MTLGFLWLVLGDTMFLKFNSKNVAGNHDLLLEMAAMDTHICGILGPSCFAGLEEGDQFQGPFETQGADA